jgi:hypothetical protein
MVHLPSRSLEHHQVGKMVGSRAYSLYIAHAGRDMVKIEGDDEGDEEYTHACRLMSNCRIACGSMHAKFGLWNVPIDAKWGRGQENALGSELSPNLFGPDQWASSPVDGMHSSVVRRT